LSFGSGDLGDRITSQAHLSTSAPLSRPGTGPGIQPVIQQRRPGGAIQGCAGFLSAFTRRHSLLGHPVPAREFRSPHGRPTDPPPGRPGLCRGSHVPHAWVATGLGASFTPGRRCPPDRRSLSDRRLPLPNGQPYTPLKPPTGGAADNGAYEDSLAFTRPVFPSPVTPGWNGSASAFTLGFAPRGYPRRTPGRGRPYGHWTGSHPRLPTSNRR